MTSLRPRRSLLPALCAAAALSVSALPAHADDDDDGLQPFRAGVTLFEFLGPPTSDCFLKAPAGGGAAAGNISGSGLSSAVGAFTLTSLDCITSASPQLLPPLKFSSKQFVLTAANGDRITAEYSGKATALPNGYIALSGSYTFTSGTGRFAGVKGSGSIEGLEDIGRVPGTGNGYVLMTGKINR